MRASSFLARYSRRLALGSNRLGFLLRARFIFRKIQSAFWRRSFQYQTQILRKVAMNLSGINRDPETAYAHFGASCIRLSHFQKITFSFAFAISITSKKGGFKISKGLTMKAANFLIACGRAFF
jgi:hypothetical protein